jgi:predicted Zn-dependent protease
MGQEVSVSYQAVKSRVYKLIDSLVEGSKTEEDVQASVRRWWKLIHPTDRPMAQKYLREVLLKSNATLAAISDGLTTIREVEALREPPVTMPKGVQFPDTQPVRSFMGRSI